MSWLRRHKPDPPPDPDAALLALAAEALACRPERPDVMVCVSISPSKPGGEGVGTPGCVSVAALMPCRAFERLQFSVGHHTPAMVRSAMGQLVLRVDAHIRRCPDAPLELGPFEIVPERGGAK